MKGNLKRAVFLQQEAQIAQKAAAAAEAAGYPGVRRYRFAGSD